MFERISLILLMSVVMAYADAIDFTPNFETSREDGIVLRRMYFTSGRAKIVYEPAGACEVRGTSEAVRLVPKSLSEAEARIENAPAQMPSEFDENGLKVYRAHAQSLLPQDAEEVTPLQEKRDAIPINDWRGFEKTFTYTRGGRKFVRAILFIKLDAAREIRLIVTSRDVDFAKFYPAVFASLNTWFEVRS